MTKLDVFINLTITERLYILMKKTNYTTYNGFVNNIKTSVEYNRLSNNEITYINEIYKDLVRVFGFDESDINEMIINYFYLEPNVLSILLRCVLEDLELMKKTIINQN